MTEPRIPDKTLRTELPTQGDTCLESSDPAATTILMPVQVGVQETPHDAGTVNPSSLEEGIARPASIRVSSALTERNSNPLSYRSLLLASTTPYTTPPRRLAKVAPLPPLPPLRTTPSVLRAHQQEDDMMERVASEDDEPPPTYVSN